MNRLLVALLLANVGLACWYAAMITGTAVTTNVPDDAGALDDVAALRLVAERPPDPPEQPLACVALGPFDALDQVEEVREEIVAKGGEAIVREEEVPEALDYLVYVETDGSRAEARRLARELEAHEIECYIMAGGQHEDSLSVGVFSRRDLAAAQRRRVAELGYPVGLEPVPRSVRKVYRLLTSEAMVGRGAHHPITDC